MVQSATIEKSSKSGTNEKHYLTDIYKVFFFTNTQGSYNYYQRENFIQQKELLQKEIDLIKPDVIISFGSKSIKQFNEGFRSKAYWKYRIQFILAPQKNSCFTNAAFIKVYERQIYSRLRTCK